MHHPLENNPGVWLANVHPASECRGPACPIHKRTDHGMRSWVQHWRGDRSLMERLCPEHGIGHPDPDYMISYRSRHDENDTYYESVHGCCGCCRGMYQGPTYDMATVEWADLARPTPQPRENTMTTDPTPAGNLPPAWRDLLTGLAILAQHPADDISPLHCEHDELTVMADPDAFTEEEIERLVELGFHVGDNGETFHSFRFGSA